MFSKQDSEKAGREGPSGSPEESWAASILLFKNIFKFGNK